ncbi:MAG: Endoribonuclease YbeY [Candidatus Anoxychlamydiales bacterium]|nr:Endoribonuclease YbeY [Candidatus Anoxychlamydiales bacterium]
MKIIIVNEQSDLEIDENLIKNQVEKILEKENIKTDELILYFVNEKTIKDLHNKFFNDPSLTDCISLPIDSITSKESHHILGEVFICPSVAVKYAKKNKLDPHFENTYYIIHSLLHLMGYDDIDKNDRVIMKKKEKEIIEHLKETNLL